LAQIPSIAIVVPTLNAGPAWREWWAGVQAQTLRPQEIWVLDSESTDDTVAIARAAGARVQVIPRREFNHGGTRQCAVALAEADVLVYMTQDAILVSPDSLAQLARVFTDASIGAAYGRQLPRPEALPIERHGRLFSYPAVSHRVTPENRSAYGIRGPFLSDSFTAYRRSALQQCGGFPLRAIVSEDMYVGGRMLMANWSLAYVAEATVRHSHSYTLMGDVRRYFDIGAFYSEQPWLLSAFGGGNGEGLRFVRSELGYLLRHAPWRVPEALLRTAIKLIAFNAGRRQQQLTPSLRLWLSGQKYYWNEV
jgi:rhamnosyltransferase